MMIRKRMFAVITALALASGRASAQDYPGSSFITLGTNGGPIPSASRSEPANVILIGSGAYLVDVGDGTVEQLAKAGVRIPQIKAVFISHLHFDHVGGLSALIGLRHQAAVPGKLKIYGPPGTKELVAGLVNAMEPSARAGYGVPGEIYVAPAGKVDVVELTDGSEVGVGPMMVKARQNTHYSFAPASEIDRQYKSLSFRFDLPDRSIAFTGDTGPSAAVEELARDADLLVTEMIDLPMTLANIQQARMTSEPTTPAMVEHLREQHLTPEEVGKLAGRANVKSLVVTHLVAPLAQGADILQYEAIIGHAYSGPVVIASDLDRF